MTARVLVVDDILSNVKLLEAKLTAEYFEVVSAFNGLECLAKIDQAAPDIVLLDVMMPGMDGFEVCRRIKNNSKTAHIPVVMVTALDQPSDRVAGLDAGADDFLTKPVDDAALFARVRSLVRPQDDDRRTAHARDDRPEHGADRSGDHADGREPDGPHPDHRGPPESVQWFANALQPGGHEVASVDTFEEALVRVRGGDYDLIVVSLACAASTACACARSSVPCRRGATFPILVVVHGRRPAQAEPGARNGRQRLPHPSRRQE